MRIPGLALLALAAIAVRGLHAAVRAGGQRCSTLASGMVRCYSERPDWADPVGIVSGLMLVGVLGTVGLRLARRRR